MIDTADCFEKSFERPRARLPSGTSFPSCSGVSLPQPSPSDPSYLQGLNAPQREAVLTTEGRCWCWPARHRQDAALTARLAHLIATRRAWPSEILAVTFTNKAAREMRERVGRIVGDAVEGMPWLGTFHSVAAKMLRRHAELVGLQANFTILDTDDQLRLLEAADRRQRSRRESAGRRAAWPA
jgi:DNA helicase-2/ATP-dependent DNA helicase PcrA